MPLGQAMENPMAAVERAYEAPLGLPRYPDSVGHHTPVAQLAMLHAEARETARLANLLGRSIHAAAGLVAMSAVTLVAADAWGARALVWAGFMLAAAGVIALAYRRTIAQPFERAPLKSFSQDLKAILMFAGVAWGAGAFLGLPASAGIGYVVLFGAGGSAAIAVLLREPETALHFLAPTAALASFACVLRPLSGGALGAGFVLIACAAVAGVAVLAARSPESEQIAAEWANLPSS